VRSPPTTVRPRDSGALARAGLLPQHRQHARRAPPLPAFPAIPHYHAVEAARAICPVLGEYYRFDPTPFAEAAWREVKGVHLRRARRGRTQGRRLLVQQQVLAE